VIRPQCGPAIILANSHDGRAANALVQSVVLRATANAAARGSLADRRNRTEADKVAEEFQDNFACVEATILKAGLRHAAQVKSELLLRDCDIGGGHVGVHVAGPWAKVRLMDNCTVHHSLSHGVMVEDGAECRIFGSCIMNNDGWGLAVHGAHSEASLEAGEFHASVANLAGDLDLSGEVDWKARCAVYNNEGTGIFVYDSARVDLHDVQVYNNTGGGIRCSDDGSFVCVQGCQAPLKQDEFVRVENKASAQISETKRLRGSEFVIEAFSTINGNIGDGDEYDSELAINRNTRFDTNFTPNKLLEGTAVAKEYIYTTCLNYARDQNEQHRKQQQDANKQILYIGPKVVPLKLEGETSFHPYKECYVPDPNETKTGLKRLELKELSASEVAKIELSGKDFSLICKFRTKKDGAGTLISKTSRHPFEMFGSYPFKYGKSWYVSPTGQLDFSIGGPQRQEGHPGTGVAMQTLVGNKKVNDGEIHVATLTYRKSTGVCSQYVDLSLDDLQHENWKSMRLDVEQEMQPFEDDPEHGVKIGFTNSNFPEPSYFAGEIFELIYLPMALEPKNIAKFAPSSGRGNWPFWKIVENWESSDAAVAAKNKGLFTRARDMLMCKENEEPVSQKGQIQAMAPGEVRLHSSAESHHKPTEKEANCILA